MININFIQKSKPNRIVDANITYKSYKRSWQKQETITHDYEFDFPYNIMGDEEVVGDTGNSLLVC